MVYIVRSINQSMVLIYCVIVVGDSGIDSDEFVAYWTKVRILRMVRISLSD